MEQNEQAAATESTAAAELELDQAKLQDFRNRIEGEQNLPMAVLAGFVTALIGAVIWAAVTVATKYQIGWMAIGVGVLVGFSVGKFGRGISTSFGAIGAVFAMLGCALGNLLSTCGFISIHESAPFLEVVTSILSQPAAIFSVMKETFDPMDLLFYALAMHQGYSLSFRQITEEEMAALTVDQ